MLEEQRLTHRGVSVSGAEKIRPKAIQALAAYQGGGISRVNAEREGLRTAKRGEQAGAPMAGNA